MLTFFVFFLCNGNFVDLTEKVAFIISQIANAISIAHYEIDIGKVLYISADLVSVYLPCENNLKLKGIEIFLGRKYWF